MSFRIKIIHIDKYQAEKLQEEILEKMVATLNLGMAIVESSTKAAEILRDQSNENCNS
jgi:tRNA A37 threonylcarbamoyladenosine biosynthesis protein TsaE